MRGLYSGELEIQSKGSTSYRQECANWITRNAIFRSNSSKESRQKPTCMSGSNKDSAYMPLQDLQIQWSAQILEGAIHAKYLHGERPLDARAKYSQKIAELNKLGSIAHRAGVIVGPKIRGRKSVKKVRLSFISQLLAK